MECFHFNKLNNCRVKRFVLGYPLNYTASAQLHRFPVLKGQQHSFRLTESDEIHVEAPHPCPTGLEPNILVNDSCVNCVHGTVHRKTVAAPD